MKLRYLLIAGLLALSVFMGFAGCTTNADSSPQEQVSSPEDSSSSFLDDLPTYYPEKGAGTERMATSNE